MALDVDPTFGMRFQTEEEIRAAKEREAAEDVEIGKYQEQLRREENPIWGAIKTAANAGISSLSYATTDLARLGVAAATGGAEGALEYSRKERAREREYPIATKVGEFGIPLVAALASFGATAPGAAASVAARQGIRGLSRATETRVGRQIALQAAESRVGEIAARTAAARSAGLAAQLEKEAVERLAKAAEESAAKRLAASAISTTSKPGKRALRAAVDVVGAAYKRTPMGAADVLSRYAASAAEKRLASRFIGDQSTRAQRSAVRRFAEDLAVKVPTRAVTAAAVDMPLYTLGRGIHEGVLELDPTEVGDYMAANIAPQMMSGLEFGGYFGLAEVFLPRAFKAASSAFKYARDELPFFGRNALKELWTSDGAETKTGVLRTTAEFLFDNKELFDNAARYWPSKTLGNLFDVVRDLEPESAEFFVRNHKEIVKVAESLPPAEAKSLVRALRNNDELQNVWLLTRSGEIASINAQRPGFFAAMSRTFDADNGAWSMEAADELLSVAKGAFLTETGAASAIASVFAKKKAQVLSASELLELAYKRMSSSEDEIIGAIGQPGGPSSSAAVVESAYDLADQIGAMASSARSSPLKHSKAVISRVENEVKLYRKELEGIVGKDYRIEIPKSGTGIFQGIEPTTTGIRPLTPPSPQGMAEAYISAANAAASRTPAAKTYQQMMAETGASPADLRRYIDSISSKEAPSAGKFPPASADPFVAKSYSDLLATAEIEQGKQLRGALQSELDEIAERIRKKQVAKASSEIKSAEDVARRPWWWPRDEDMDPIFRKPSFVRPNVATSLAEESAQAQASANMLEGALRQQLGLPSAEKGAVQSAESAFSAINSPIGGGRPSIADIAIEEARSASTKPNLADFWEDYVRRQAQSEAAQAAAVTRGVPQLTPKQMVDVASLQRNFRTAIGDIVADGRQAQLGATPKFTKRFVRANGVAKAAYAAAKKTVTNREVWGDAAALRAEIDGVYSEFKRLTGRNGAFRRAFMSDEAMPAGAESVSAVVDLDKTQKVFQRVSKGLSQSADELTKAELAAVEGAVGKPLMRSPEMADMDAWHEIDRVMRDGVDIVGRRLSDLVDSPYAKDSGLVRRVAESPRFGGVNPATRERLVAEQLSKTHTSEFLRTLRRMTDSVAAETSDVALKMRNNQILEESLESLNRQIDNDIANQIGLGSVAKDLPGGSWTAGLPRFGSGMLTSVGRALWLMKAVASKLKDRWQVAPNLKAMIEADIMARNIRASLERKSENLLKAMRKSALHVAAPKKADVDTAEEKPDQELMELYEEQQKRDREIDALYPGKYVPSPGQQQEGVGKSQEQINLEELEKEQNRISQEIKEAEHATNILNRARSMTEDPDALIQKLSEEGEYISGAVPESFANATGAIQRIAQEIASIVPPKPSGLFDNEVLTKDQTSRILRTMEIAGSPQVIIDRVADGTLTQNDVESVSRMYPQMAQQMRASVYNMLSQCVKDGIPVPFGVRCAAERLLGKTVSSTTSAAIARSAQGVYSQGKQAGPGRPRQTMGPAMVANRSSGRVYGASNLGVANRLLTDKQRSESRNA